MPNASTLDVRARKPVGRPFLFHSLVCRVEGRAARAGEAWGPGQGLLSSVLAHFSPQRKQARPAPPTCAGDLLCFCATLWITGSSIRSTPSLERAGPGRGLGGPVCMLLALKTPLLPPEGKTEIYFRLIATAAHCGDGKRDGSAPHPDPTG